MTAIPAAPVGRGRSAASGSQARFEELALSDVHQDELGNVFGIRRAQRHAPFIALSAHLDTVFPTGTASSVRREPASFTAPASPTMVSGIVALLAIAGALRAGS